MMNYFINRGIQVTGVDASHSILEIAKKNFPSIEFFQQDMRQLSLNRKNGGVNLYHGSLDTNQYKELLEANEFRVLQFKENDIDCGHANVWMAQLIN
ncbi:class I SAM-dependent methyltransferase [Pseudoflavitalea rhizosphaerae]|uniref:class I SAM-dependent methyltransferase n=1 Tax=Pseudoflavitalea rhizosphaerae TaxID=1884793 RepID=UPI0019D04203|nr:class I SAM-dependent methyltransferase [Pseudoflavitalea rhizosphaerae]